MSIVNDALEKMKLARERDAKRQNAGGSMAESMHQYRPSVATPLAAVERPEQLPSTIVHVDRTTLDAAGMLPKEEHRVHSAEQYRVIKQDLLKYRPAANVELKAPSRFIMITSALPGDGKSFTSLNLALSFAGERDSDVLYIDGDVAKQHVTRTLGMGDQPGLLDMLRDSSRDFASVKYATDLPGLYFVPAGRWSEDASELLGSERMRHFLADVAARYPRRIVLFDSSPLMLTPDARALAAMAGQVVLIVREGSTLQSDVREAASLAADPGRRLTLVLNQMRSNQLFGSFYGYRYGYGYGARSSESATAASGGKDHANQK